MKTTVRLVAFIILAGSFMVKTSVGQEKDRAGGPSQTQDVQAALARFVTAFENLDWTSFRDCFSANATIFHPAAPNISRIDSPEAFDKAWLGVFERIKKNSGRTSPPYMKLKPQDVRIDRLSPEVALVTFHLVDPGTLGRRTLVFQRVDGAWKIIHVHASNVP